MQFDFQQQLSSQTMSLQEEREHQHLLEVSLILIVCPSTSAALAQLMFSCLILQLQQLEEHLQKSKEELNQLKSDLQENVEQVG